MDVNNPPEDEPPPEDIGDEGELDPPDPDHDPSAKDEDLWKSLPAIRNTLTKRRLVSWKRRPLIEQADHPHDYLAVIGHLGSADDKSEWDRIKRMA